MSARSRLLRASQCHAAPGAAAVVARLLACCGYAGGARGIRDHFDREWQSLDAERPREAREILENG